jgi:CrcB protein
MNYLLVALGGALGSVLRFWFSTLFERRWGETFPWGTLFVNVSGSFLIGLLFSLAGADKQPLLGPSARALLLVGVLGGYTTFSSFSLQALNFLRAGQFPLAAFHVLLSVALCLLAVWLGHLAARAFGAP